MEKYSIGKVLPGDLLGHEVARAMFQHPHCLQVQKVRTNLTIAVTAWISQPSISVLELHSQTNNKNALQ